MKNLIFLLVIFLFSAHLAYSQHISESKVPSAVKEAFNAQFPNASNLKWGKESSSEYEAEFKVDDVIMSANFSDDGKWVETETTIDITALPQTVVDGINRDYSNAKIVGASKIEKSDKSVFYEADIKIGKKKKEVIYDGQGNMQ